mgnify:CR=1 FL=1
MQPKIALGNFEFLPAAVKVHGKPPVEDWAGPLQFAIWCQREAEVVSKLPVIRFLSRA